MSSLLEDHKLELRDKYLKLKHDILQRREDSENTERVREDNYHRDFTRILYSSSFRRLQGKMQLLGIKADSFIRNRLTHSLEVSQIARSIANQIGIVIRGEKDSEKAYSDDIYLIEAAALAHDIGHPAFGHAGEKTLNSLCQEVQFEGNAQNFRILRHIESKFPNSKGLNLTNRTLLSIHKYDICETSDSHSKFTYRDDFEYIRSIKNQCDLNEERTLDVQIIDVADEIAYAAHDLEDALWVGVFTIDEVVFALRNKDSVSENSVDKFEELVDKARRFAFQSSGSTQWFDQIFRKELTSELINLLITDIGYVKLKQEKKEKFGVSSTREIGLRTYMDLADGLKDIVFDCVNRDVQVTVYENKGQKIIKSLYEMYSDKTYNKGYKLLTPNYRPLDLKDEIQANRGIVDYIGGMMDTFAISIYEQHFGEKFENIKY